VSQSSAMATGSAPWASQGGQPASTTAPTADPAVVDRASGPWYVSAAGQTRCCRQSVTVTFDV